MTKPRCVESIAELVSLSGFPPLEHPVFAIIRLEALRELPPLFYEPIVFKFYTAGLKKNLTNPLRYGRHTYDFSKGILGFTSPNQLMQMDEEGWQKIDGWMIFFQREFLVNHPLQQNIDRYGFFAYDVNEGLHLSEKEERILEGICENMATEYQNNPDRFSRDVILSYLALFLNYANRFYSRQFITRHQVNQGLWLRFETLLHDYFRNETYKQAGFPSVHSFAEALHVSANYLSDYLKTNTGKSTQEHIHLALIERAKVLLLSSDQSVSEIAYELGFEYPSYFSRLFKQKTGLSPKAFRVGAS